MGIVLAALDDSAAAAPVVATGVALAELFGADLEALTVRTNGAGTEAASAAAGAGVPLREIRGVPVERLINIGDRPDVVALVVGARGAVSTSTRSGARRPRSRPRCRSRWPSCHRTHPRRADCAGWSCRWRGRCRLARPRSLIELAARAEVEVVALHVRADAADALPEPAAWTEQIARVPRSGASCRRCSRSRSPCC